jgi:hypothetical protein
MPVTLGGISIFGGKDDKRRPPDAGQAPAADGVRITAVTLFGGVEVRD